MEPEFTEAYLQAQRAGYCNGLDSHQCARIYRRWRRDRRTQGVFVWIVFECWGSVRQRRRRRAMMRRAMKHG